MYIGEKSSVTYFSRNYEAHFNHLRRLLFIVKFENLVRQIVLNTLI